MGWEGGWGSPQKESGGLLSFDLLRLDFLGQVRDAHTRDIFSALDARVAPLPSDAASLDLGAFESLLIRN